MPEPQPYNLADELQADAARARDEAKQLVLDYKNTFNSERGQRVLNDLKRLFGYERPSAVAGMRSEDVWLREGMKMPMYHIEARLRTVFKPVQKQRKKAITPKPTEVQP